MLSDIWKKALKTLGVVNKTDKDIFSWSIMENELEDFLNSDDWIIGRQLLSTLNLSITIARESHGDGYEIRYYVDNSGLKRSITPINQYSDRMALYGTNQPEVENIKVIDLISTLKYSTKPYSIVDCLKSEITDISKNVLLGKLK